MLAILYDIHGNLPALEVVVARPSARERPRGSSAAITAARARGRERRSSCCGRSARDVDPRQRRALDQGAAADRPEVFETYERFLPGPFTEEELDELYSLPPRAELDGVLYVHGSVVRDDDTFATEPLPEDEERVAGVHDRTLVFGHSHLQFRRPGPHGTTCSTRAASACRSTGTCARPGRFAATTASSSSGAPSTTSSARRPDGAGSAASSERTWHDASSAGATD